MPNYTSAVLPHYVFLLALAALLLGLGRWEVGLIIEVAPGVDGTRVVDLAIDAGNLIVNHKTDSRVVRLLRGAIETITLRASGTSEGPVVVSIDGALVLSGGRYVSPAVPAPMASSLICYDVYAHDLVRGYPPYRPPKSPLNRVERLR